MKVAIAGANAGRRPRPDILSRGTIPALSDKGALIRTVAYDSPTSLEEALSGVHTAICAIGDHIRSADAQVALVHAAESADVTHFIPSGWSGMDGGLDDVVQLYRYKQAVLQTLRQMIPGDGNKKLAYTAVEDVGDFMANVLQPFA
ncbi:hypothetical protein DFH09DRAFT_1104288 [Mycena vulgaris]|nr:hypothetical protein DFH09DRAFT_1104288 [Mycena vulgaris]